MMYYNYLMYLAAIAEQCECEAKIKDYSLGGDLIADLKEFISLQWMIFGK